MVLESELLEVSQLMLKDALVLNEDIARLCRTYVDLGVRYDFTSCNAQFGTFCATRLHSMSECNMRLKAFEKSTGTAQTAAFLSWSMLSRTKCTILTI